MDILTIKTKNERAQEELQEIEKLNNFDNRKATIGSFLAAGNTTIGGIDYSLVDTTEYLDEFKKKLAYNQAIADWREKYISDKEDNYRRNLIAE